MERAERLVLLGVGLAFDILVPVLWVMLVLTAITAVQRFVKVWRQATPERPRRTRHHRGSGTEEPRAGSLAQWWAAHRPQTERTGPGSARVVADPTPLYRRRCHRVAVLPERTPYYAYRAGAEIARLRARGWSASPVARGLAAGRARVHGRSSSPGRAQPAPRARPRLRRHRAAPRGHRDLRLVRALLLRAVPAPVVRAAVDPRRTSSACGIEHVAAGVAEGRGAVLALPHLGNWDFAGAWLALPGVHRHRGRRTGRAARAVRVVRRDARPPRDAGDPALAVGRHRGARARCATTRSCACSPTATSPATGSRSSSSASAPRCPAGPALLALRGGAPLCPGRVLLPHRRAPHDADPAADPGRAGRDASATTSARVTQDLAHRFEDLIRVAPTHWHLLQPNWPSDRGSDPAAARPGVG